MAKGDRYTWKTVEGRLEKVLEEVDYRKKILLVANTLGCKIEMQALFDKWDGLLKTCKNASEIRAMQIMGIKEISDLLDNGYMGVSGSLIVHNDNESIVLIDDYKTKHDARIN